MSHPLGRLRSFFCAATDPLNLAVFRVVIFASVLRLIPRADFLQSAHLPAVLRVAPPGYESFFHWIPLEDAWVIGAQRVAVLACALALVGFMTRASAAVACICATYLFALPELFGKINHGSHHLIWFMAVLAAARCGDALSIDALRPAWRRADRGDTSPVQPSVIYTVPLRIVWLLIGVLYFFPGFWKLRAGAEWFLSDNIKYMMYQSWSEKGFLPALRIDRYPLLYRASGLATIAFEMSFVVCIFFPCLRVLALIGGVLFHSMTTVYLHIFFSGLLLCYAAFVNWSWVADRLGRVCFARDLSLVYDGRSWRSRRVIAALRSVDVLHRVSYVDAFAGVAPMGRTDSFDGIVVTTGGHAMAGWRAWLTVAFRVPLTVAVLPFVVLGLKGHGSSQRAAPPRDHVIAPRVAPQRLAAVVIVGSLLLGANIYCGLNRIVSWPFSVYPTFDAIYRTATRTSLEAVVRGPTGEPRAVEIELRAETLRRILRSDHATRAARLIGVRDLLTQSQVVLQPGEVLQLYEVSRSTLPEDYRRAPLQRELLAEFQADGAAQP